jgi:hypothetical protein
MQSNPEHLPEFGPLPTFFYCNWICNTYGACSAFTEFRLQGNREWLASVIQEEQAFYNAVMVQHFLIRREELRRVPWWW